jgi:hypothetical protein
MRSEYNGRCRFALRVRPRHLTARTLEVFDMAIKTLPTTALLRSRLTYDPVTGHLIWKVGRLNGRRAGSQLFSGYRGLVIDGVIYQEHRIIWKLVTGRNPSAVDHANLIRNDNRWANLRVASRSQQSANCHLRRNNTTGLKGVGWRRSRNVWVAQIRVNHKAIYLGQFATPELAHEAYCAAALKHFGPFARLR